MSFMRTPYYVWSSGEYVHIDQKTMDQESFDELCVMVALRIISDDGIEEFNKIAERAYENHGGNFGCDGVATYLQKPATLDEIRAAIRRMQLKQKPYEDSSTSS